MSGITVLSPLGVNRVGSQPIAARLRSPLETFHTRRLTDGLPFVLPTAERVRAMIAGAGRRASEVIAVIPPRWAEATVGNVAINAVMTGCLP